MLRLEKILGGINRVSGVNLSLEHRDYSEISRVLLPGQLLRFESDTSVRMFLNTLGLLEDDYEIVSHTDPLGFDSEWYPEGNMNPKNYLRRNQLPNLHIDMTNIYKPEFDMGVDLKKTGISPTWFMPMLHSDYMNGASPHDTVSPQLARDSGWGYYVSADEISRGGVFSSPIDLPTFQGTRARALRLGDNYILAGIKTTDKFYVYSYVSSSIVRTTITAIFPRELPSTAAIPQAVDRSNPTVGFFWFNDGNYPQTPFGQIELPKDPECKIFPIIKIRRVLFI